jgi:hypothetical protein
MRLELRSRVGAYRTNVTAREAIKQRDRDKAVKDWQLLPDKSRPVFSADL